MKQDIKTYREKELRAYVIGNILLVLIFAGLLNPLLNELNTTNLWNAVSAVISSALLSTVGYIYVFIADSLIPSNAKQKIIWLKNGLPGEHIFTDIRLKNTDTRFTTGSVLTKYADVYSKIEDEKDPDKKRKIENSHWYQIYKIHEEEATVYVSQRDYLLSRDMCAITIWIIIGFVVLTCILGLSFHWELLVFMIVEMIATWIVARIKGKRFAYNVIAADLIRKE